MSLPFSAYLFLLASAVFFHSHSNKKDSQDLPVLPPATTVVGHTAGEFSVNESGAATYTIPITVSPGTGGMEPGLLLTYSSQSGNGILGVGWSLSGLSVITRCKATLAQDSLLDGIDFDSNDKFCLDGERLVAISGAYGANGTEYRTEQNTFSKVVSYGSAGNGPEKFKVWTKAGLILEFAYTVDSRIEAQGKSEVLFWAVNRIEDTKGNYLTISYTEDNANGEYYPDRIDYTGNANASLTPYNHVQFTYELRADSTIAYLSGSILKTRKRLKTIESFHAATAVRTYEMAYRTVEKISHLRSVRECGMNGECFDPTTFDWHYGSDVSGNYGGQDFWGIKTDEYGAIDWENNYGGVAAEIPYDGTTTTDGKYILAGLTDSNNNNDVGASHGGRDGWVVKLTETGAIEWAKNYGGTNSDEIRAIDQTMDGGFIIAGWSQSNNGDLPGNYGNKDVWVAKLSSTGTVQWSKNYGGSAEDYGSSVVQTLDGGFIVAGWSKSSDHDLPGGNYGNQDYWVFKINSAGNIVWQKNYGGAGSDFASSVIPLPDGTFCVAGYSNSNNGDLTGNYGQYDFWVIKLNASGILIWQKNYGGTLNEYAFDIISTIDNGFLVSGLAESDDFDVSDNYGLEDVWVAKLDTLGTLQWEGNFGGTNSETARGAWQNADGSYLVAGMTWSNDGDVSMNNGVGFQDAWLLKINATGSLEWEENYGGPLNDDAYGVIGLSDESIFLVGQSEATLGYMNFVKTMNPIPPADIDNGQLFYGDWNGDGASDILWFDESVAGNNRWYVNNGNFGFSLYNNPVAPGEIHNGKLYFGDWNADGLIDFMWLSNDLSGANKWFINQGNLTFSSPTNNPIPIAELANNQVLFFEDFNGDGRTDLLHFFPQINGVSSGINKWFINDGNLNFTQTNNPIYTGEIGNGDLYAGDWNNDGLTDVAWFSWFGSGANKWFLNQGNLSFTTTTNPIPESQLADRDKLHFGDWNGDGITDFLWFNGVPGNPQDGYNKWYINDGALHFTLTQNPIYHGEISNGDLRFGDWNGDGLTDLMWYFQAEGSNKWFINQKNFIFQITTNPITQSEITNGDGLRFGDWNGDGITDATWFDSSPGTNNWFVSNKTKTNLIRSITTGHGVRTEINYLPLSDSLIYTKHDTAAYPEMDFQAAVYVVSSYKMTNGIGGMNEVAYHYEGATYGLTGRGFRGFKKTTITDLASGIKNVIIYDRNYALVGSKVKRTEQYTPGNLLINETDNVNAAINFGNGIHFSYVEQSTSKRYELNGSLVSTSITRFQYDNFGNPTSIIVNYGGGFVDTTTNIYVNDSANWLLGRLTQTTVTRKAPGKPDITRKTSFAYHPVSGLLTQEVIEPTHPTLKLTKNYVHDVYGNILQSEWVGNNDDSLETRTTTTTFDSFGRFVSSATNALGHSETKVFDPLLGNLISITDPNGLTTSWTYDGFGRKIQEMRPDSSQTTITYQFCDGAGNEPSNCIYFVETQSTGFAASKMHYDILDRGIRSQIAGFDGTPVFADMEYDSLGREIKKSDPYFDGETVYWNEFEYDMLDRVIEITAPGNRITTSDYQGLTTTAANPLNQIRTQTENLAGRVVSVSDHLSSQTTYDYDATGNLLAVTDPAGNQTTMIYNIRGNKTQMNDPDMGLTTYVYNAFGELKSSTDALGNTVTYHYDKLGRTIKRTESEGITEWIYDNKTTGVGKLGDIKLNGQIAESNLYDTKSRLKRMDEYIAGENYHSLMYYDSAGRISSLYYPSGLAVKHVYNSQGYHSELRNLTDNTLYWKAEQRNARGQLEEQTLGNGLKTIETFNAQTGFLTSIKTETPNTSNLIQHLGFTFNAIGNLIQRKDLQHNYQEDFTYDGLNRLTNTSVAGQYAVNVAYNAIGNITFKSDVGVYAYGENGAGPHAVTSINSAGLANCTKSFDGTVTYTSYKKASAIVQDTDSLVISYNPDRQRNQQLTYRQDTLAQTKRYFGKLYEWVQDSTTKQLNYLFADDQAIGIVKVTNNGAPEMEYLHRDHLGSVQAITDGLGNLISTFSYDAWGKRRNTDWSQPSENLVGSFDRGFTGHEHLDIFSLINMNGRIYDPVIGRFLSPDPFVQDVLDLQSLNRYTYVLNNPLSLTDPSGFFFKKLFKSIGNFFKENWKTIVSVGAGILTGGALYAAFTPGLGFWGAINATLAGNGGILSAAGFGFGSSAAGTLLNGGSLGEAFKAGFKSAIVAGASAFVSKGIDTFLPDWMETSKYVRETNGQNALSVQRRILIQALRNTSRGVLKGISSEVKGSDFKKAFLLNFASDNIRTIRDAFTEWRTIKNISELESPPFSDSRIAEMISASRSSFRVSTGKPSANKYSLGLAVLDPKVSNVGIPIGDGFSGRWEFLNMFTSENSVAMRALSKIPGMNSMSVFHDQWAANWHKEGAHIQNFFSSQMTIPIAIGIEYAGLYGTLP